MLRFVLIGHPVSHSISPALHNATYREMGADASYEAVDCPDPEAVAEQVRRIRGGELTGANVTVPWKREALALADWADASAAQTGAANTLVADASGSSGRVGAYNTDVIALAECLRLGLSACAATSENRGALVLGSGGAALAAVVACRGLASDPVWVSSRRWLVAEPTDQWLRADEFSKLGAQPLAWDTLRDWLASDADSTPALIVQATSAGMHGAGSGQSVVDVLPWDCLPNSTFAYDVVYNPSLTPFLERAKQRGLAHSGGLAMLVVQAARAIELWLGRAPPEAFMQRVAERSIFGR